jgi:hypothetical protein
MKDPLVPNRRKGRVGRFDGRNGGGGKRRMRRPAGLFSFYKKLVYIFYIHIMLPLFPK